MLVFLFLFISNIILHRKDYLYTYVKCDKSKYNRTCVYRNIYYQKGNWIAINLNKNKIKCVSVRSRNKNLCFKPLIKKYIINYNKVIKGLTTYIRLFYSYNIGHLLWDDLYSIYLSFLKLNYSMNPFNIILSKYDNKWRDNWQSKIFEIFSLNKLLYENDMQNYTYLIETLIVGHSHQCQRCVNKEYYIPGGKEYNATWWMRKRMYHVYNITNCSNKNAIIVNNKRYSIEDKKILYDIKKSYSNSILNITYIDWKKIQDFKTQLEVLSCTNIYISGPGTGLLNFPFISDPGIIVNLGGLYRGCPAFMEQYIEEGSMHFISLYYPSKKRKNGLKKNEIIQLINRALYILKNWKVFKKHHNSNLNIEGVIFKSISKTYPSIMNKFLKETDWAKENGIGVWAERLIYFPYCYNISYIIEIVFNLTKKYENQLGCKISRSKVLCK